jgi:HEAT repeat protein
VSSQRKTWENLKAEYLNKVEKALSSVKHPHMATGYDAASQKQKDAMVEQWIEAIHGLDYEIAVLATAALGDVKAQKSVAVLTEVATTKGGDNRIKWIAVRGLAKIADCETVAVLIGLIDHYNKNVRIYAKVALAEITGQFFGDSKEQWHKWWQENKHKK